MGNSPHISNRAGVGAASEALFLSGELRSLRPPQTVQLSESVLASLDLARREKLPEEILPPKYPLVEYRDAPESVLRLLDQRLRHVAVTDEKLEALRRPAIVLRDIFSRHELGAVSAAQHFVELCNQFDTAAEDFRREFQSLREMRFSLTKTEARALADAFCGAGVVTKRSGHWYRVHHAAYPEQSRSVLALVKAVSALQGMRSIIAAGDSADPLVLRWLQTMDRRLQNPELQAILGDAVLMKAASAHYFSPFMVKEWQPDKATRNRFKRHYRSDSWMAIREFSDLGSACSMHRMGREEAENVAASIKAVVEHYADIHRFKQPRRLSPGPSGNQDRYPRLVGFCGPLRTTLVAELGLQARSARQLVDGSGAFAAIAPYEQGLHLAKIVNPVFAKEDRRRELGALMGGIFGAIATLQGFLDGPVPVKRAQPISITLGDGERCLGITGPNAVGKTMAAKTLLQVIAINQAGLPLRCEAATLPLFRNLHTVFPPENSVTPGYGFLASGLRRATAIISNLGPQEILLLDEIPAGSDHDELVAMVVTLVEAAKRKGATVAFTTHIKDAVRRLSEKSDVRVVQTSLRETDDGLVPEYDPKPGIARHSYGIELMAALGFSADVVNSARAYYEAITGEPYPTQMNGVLRTDIVPTPGIRVDLALLDCYAKTLLGPNAFVFGSGVTLTEALIALEPLPELTLKLLAERPYKIAREKEFGAQLKPQEVQERAQQNLAALAAIVELPDHAARVRKGLRSLLTIVTEAAKTQQGWGRPAPVRLEQVAEWERLLGSLVEKGLIPQQSYLTQLFSELQSNLKPVREFTAAVQRERDAATHETREQVEQQLARQWAGIVGLNVDALGMIDWLYGHAQVIRRHNLLAPEFVDDAGVITISKAKPVDVQSCLWAMDFPDGRENDPFISAGVPVEFSFDPKTRINLLLGPNSSGKTLAELTMFCCVRQAIAGFYVPAEIKLSRQFCNATGFFGSRHDPLGDLSYFTGMLSEIKTVLEKAGNGDVLFLDELHGGDFSEMAAIQLAVARKLHECGATVLYNTHIRDGVSEFRTEVPTGIYRTVYEFDPARGRLVPHFQIVPDPDMQAKSHGLAIAQQFFSSAEVETMMQIYKSVVAQRQNKQ